MKRYIFNREKMKHLGKEILEYVIAIGIVIGVFGLLFILTWIRNKLIGGPLGAW